MITTDSTRPDAPETRSVRKRRLVALLATIPLLAGATVAITFGSTAQADPPGWATITLEEDVTDAYDAGYFHPEYAVDSDDFVHLRGAVGTEDITVVRPGVTAGPFMAHVFTIPCELAPARNQMFHIGTGNQDTVTVGYNGVLYMTAGGQGYIGAFDLPVFLDGDHNVASFVAAIDGVTFPKKEDTGPCESEETTTTAEEPTTTVEETTTTIEE